MVRFAVPQLEYIDIPLFVVIPLMWFMFLWTFQIFFGRCECGSFYHTEKDKKEFFNFVWFSILSSLVILAGLMVWGL